MTQCNIYISTRKISLCREMYKYIKHTWWTTLGTLKADVLQITNQIIQSEISLTVHLKQTTHMKILIFYYMYTQCRKSNNVCLINKYTLSMQYTCTSNS